MGKSRVARQIAPTLSFRARIFVALVGISSVTSLIIGLVLYSFSQDQLTDAEKTMLVQRSQTANAGAQDFLETLRAPEDHSPPPAEEYARDLVTTVADPTGLGVLYVAPDGRPLAGRDGLGNPVDPVAELERLDLAEREVGEVARSTLGEGRLVWSEGRDGFVAVWPLVGREGVREGDLIYDVAREGIEATLSSLRFGILGAILTSVLLAAAAGLLF